MIVEAASIVAVLLICWYLNFRPRSTNQLRPPYQSHRTPASLPACDYVVVGGGAAGLAAAAELLRRTCEDSHILLVERGADAQSTNRASLLLEAGRRDRLLSFAPDLVRVPPEALPRGVQPTFLTGTPDEGRLARRPWHSSKAEESVVAALTGADGAGLAKANRYRLLQYASYPRGVGLGGTAQLDWGVHLNSIWPTPGEGAADACPVPESRGSATSPTASHNVVAEAPLWARLPVRLAFIRNPLSWAFAEAVKSLGLAAAHMPTPAAPVERGTVFPFYLCMDEDGRRLALPSAVLGGIAPDVLRRRLSVLTGYSVVDLDLEAPASVDGSSSGAAVARVTAVRVCRSGGGAEVSIPVGRGVLLACGALHSPRLLYRVAARGTTAVPRPPQATARLRDALALPLIFAAVPAVSADAFNARDAKATAMWWLTQRGPYLTPLTDTALSLSLPHISPEAEVRIVFFPFGGRDAARFKGMSWDTVLGTPLQAFTMLLVVHGIDGLEHTLALDEEAAPPGAARARALCPHEETRVLSAEVQRKVHSAFVAGIKECRRLSKTGPLASLALEPGAESTDFTLLVPHDEGKAVRLAQLARLSAAKRSARGKRELRELREWSRCVTGTEAYMHSYVDAHAYWLGFASGSSEPFLQSSTSARVAGLQNAVVGDTSAVTTAQWSGVGKRDSLAAGSRSTTMDAAVRAAGELVDSCCCCGGRGNR
ncbi:FAD dependent oxidoreductase [Novymonas esmeraldas]|uniref:FAD dependent oxidoreductase n=1 Tax=Novymonas esmeraldas TaxID=1808958 RepID=A0AAW0F3L1_9TRYP